MHASKPRVKLPRGDGDLCDNDGNLGLPGTAQVGRIDLVLHHAPTWCPRRACESIKSSSSP